MKMSELGATLTNIKGWEFSGESASAVARVGVGEGGCGAGAAVPCEGGDVASGGAGA